MQSYFESKVEAKVEDKVEAKVEAKVESKAESRVPRGARRWGSDPKNFTRKKSCGPKARKIFSESATIEQVRRSNRCDGRTCATIENEFIEGVRFIEYLFGGVRLLSTLEYSQSLNEH